MFRFSGGGTFADGTPQITTRPRGRGWVIWSIEGATDDKLLAVPVLLASRTRTVTASSRGNTAHLTGPASCLTAVTVKLRVRGSAARHWHVASTELLLGGKSHGGSLNGASLAPGKSYKLSGKVIFADGAARKTVTAHLTFRGVPEPLVHLPRGTGPGSPAGRRSRACRYAGPLPACHPNGRAGHLMSDAGAEG